MPRGSMKREYRAAQRKATLLRPSATLPYWVLIAARRLRRSVCNGLRTNAGSVASDHAVDPGRERIQNLSTNLCIFSARSRRYVEGMVGISKQRQRGPAPKLFAKRLELIERRQRIAGALQE